MAINFVRFLCYASFNVCHVFTAVGVNYKYGDKDLCKGLVVPSFDCPRIYVCWLSPGVVRFRWTEIVAIGLQLFCSSF